MSINKENIEEHIFDYLEGNLSDEQILEFRAYINSNSEAKSELEFWEQSYVVDHMRMDSSEFSNLKKSNKLYYWLGGIGIGFVLTSSIFWFSNSAKKPVNVQETLPKVEKTIIMDTQPENIEVESQELPIVKPALEKVEEVKVENVFQEISESEKTTEIEEIDMDNVEYRSVEINSVNSDRKTISKKVNLKKFKEESKKKSKEEVDVIELNSEGF